MCEAGFLQEGRLRVQQPNPHPYPQPPLISSSATGGRATTGPLVVSGGALYIGLFRQAWKPANLVFGILTPQSFPGSSRKLFLKSSNLGDKLIPIFSHVDHSAQSSAAAFPSLAQKRWDRTRATTCQRRGGRSALKTSNPLVGGASDSQGECGCSESV